MVITNKCCTFAHILYCRMFIVHILCKDLYNIISIYDYIIYTYNCIISIDYVVRVWLYHIWLWLYKYCICISLIWNPVTVYFTVTYLSINASIPYLFMPDLALMFILRFPGYKYILILIVNCSFLLVILFIVPQQYEIY